MRRRAERRAGARRAVAFTGAAALIPAVPLTLSRLPGPTDVVVLLACGGGAAVVALALMVRLMTVSRTATRRAAELGRALGQRDALERELRHRATHDPLTALGNRTLLTQRLDELLRGDHGGDHGGDHAGDHSGGHAGPMVLLLMDLDGFAELNDTLGHPAGDQVLVDTARRLRRTVPAATLIARTGGDEFALLCPEPADRATEVARSILAAVRRPYHVEDRDVHLTASIGLLDLAGLRSSAEALRDADLALYAAKGAGRDRVAAFHTGLRSARVRRSDLADGLRRALADGALDVHYQPVVDLVDGRMAAVEALARWAGPDGQPVPPAQFIPVAEETGLIVPIGRWVLRQACCDARRWHERYGISVTVNVSGRQLTEPDFADTVLAALTDSGLPGRALILELTESTLIAHREAAVALGELRAHGVRVALDDFGTGYSSLSYLVDLPVDILKIDRAFTAPARETVPRDWAFTRAILDLADSLHLVAIAEGVETSAQAQALRTLHCPLAQGYLYSRPVPAAAIDPMLATWNQRSSEPAGIAAR